MRVSRTRNGARLTQGGAVLSEILAAPGPTGSVFDVLAAAVAALAPGPRVAVLGFCGGGIVGPLRAMGCDSAIEAVDRDMRGAALFREFCGGWAGRVRVDEGDAVRWLGRRRGRFDAVIDDLSELGVEGETKPCISLTAVPGCIARRLGDRGLAVINLLPVPGVSWRRLERQVVAPWGGAVAVHAGAFENRVLLTGPRPPQARRAGAAITAALRAIGSEMASDLHFRSVAPR